MSSADPGAPGVRPADVEGWLADLGLTPAERADRDGIASWDLLLDGRRRFDLRVTVILDPALALICWAHYAPPISDMFRKSYRRLLRWNDEFPFAKFSCREDERPLLAVEVPIETADADALGLALARILGIADRLLDELKDWLWLGGRMPDRGDRTSAKAEFLDRYAAACPSWSDPDDARGLRRYGGDRGARRPEPVDMSRRSAAPALLAFVAATGLLATPGGRAEVRAAAPGLTIVGSARYDVQPEAERVRVTLDMAMTNRLPDTRTKRYYFDHAILGVLPGVSGLKASWSGAGMPRAKVSKATSTYTLVRIDLAKRLYSHKSATIKLVFDLVDKGGAATGRSGSARPSCRSRSGPSPRTRRRAAASAWPSPPATRRGPVRGDPVGQQRCLRPDRLPDAQAGQAAVVLRLPVADRPGSYAERTVKATVGDVPVDLTIRGWVEDGGWSTRVGGLVGRALPMLSERIGLPWPRDGGLVVHETISRSTGGYAGLFDPAKGQIEVAYDAGDDVVLHEAAHTWFNGGLLADRWANEAFASYYGLEAAAALKIKVRAGADTSPRRWKRPGSR